MTVRVKNKAAQAIQKQAGIAPGDLIEFTAAKGKITIRSAPQTYAPTTAEAAAIRKGRAAYRRGDYVTLGQLHKEHAASHRASEKRSRKAS
jgi:hypothetical protein